MLLYALTILVSAFLLFQVQPVIAKIILPWFGGSAAVWTVCLLFFQLALLAGYFYAYALVRYLKPRLQGLVHAVLLVSESGHVAYLSERLLEARQFLASRPGNLVSACRQDRRALFPALHYRSAAASLVLAQVQRGHALPPLRALERRFDVRAAQLSVPFRARFHHASAGLHVVPGLRELHRALWIHRATLAWSRGGRVPGGGRRGRGSAAAASETLLDVAGAARRRLRAAARHHQSPLAECRGHPVPLGVAAQHLPAHLHPLFRGRLVLAQSVPATASRCAWAAWHTCSAPT